MQDVMSASGRMSNSALVSFMVSAALAWRRLA